MNDVMKVIETERLYLRELVPADRDELAKVLCDAESMIYYPAPFTLKRVEQWIEWNIDNYGRYGHGLWAVIRKEDGAFLGDCGVTMQDIEGEMMPEVGYHIIKQYCRQGYASEAAKACMDYVFKASGYKRLVTYTKSDNIPSIGVALKNGMTFVKNFEKVVMGETVRESLYQTKNLL